MILSARRVALILIPLLAGVGLLALAWSFVFGPAPIPLPPPFLSTQANLAPLSNLPPPTSLADAPVITIAANPYRHPSGAFAINYPDSWQIDEAEDSVQFTAPDEEPAQFSVMFTNSEAVTNGTYEQDLHQTWGDLASFAIKTLDSDPLADPWTATFTFTQTEPPNQTTAPMIGYTLYWQRQNVRYIFVALIARSRWEQLRPMIQSIANTLQTYPNAIINDSE